MFAEMVSLMKEQTIGRLFHVQITQQENPEEKIHELQQRMPQKMELHKALAPEVTDPEGDPEKTQAEASPKNIKRDMPQPTVRRQGEKVGRNDVCPCGSGKKYKKCHGDT